MPRSSLPNPDSPSRATLQDVARAAGVGLATVDRVLNQRPGVREGTVRRVAEAVLQLNYRPDPAAARLAQKRVHRVAWVLPSGHNSFVSLLRDRIAENDGWMRDHRLQGRILSVDVFEPAILAHALLSLREDSDTVIVMALDHPLVQAAINGLVAAGRTVITLVSDVPGSARQHFVGIGNVAAGRTAATLLGRFLGARKGAVAVVAGSLGLRDHADRCFGFQQIMASDFAPLRVLPAVEGKDDSARTEDLLGRLLDTEPNLIGIYSVGAGNPGIAAALRARARSRNVVFVAHELTGLAREALLDGTMDAVINQDAGHEVRSALRLTNARLTQEPLHPDQERIRIDIYTKDNLP